jgi:tetratricopeptide (TPR) repeat protein
MAQTTLRDYLQETEDAIASDRIDDALTRCQYILTYFPEALEAQRLLGEVYLAQEDLENAQQMFDWILLNDPENIIAYCNRALISERCSDIETALDCYQQAYELSRGNSQIRQQFNALSARTEQQGFMLSRAGLARLYMWGDLLSQAIQEWETVLSTTPDRLDARVGLLETYWREGLSNQVEQMARQILLDVPGCLKVLLLLAHVVSGRNMQEAQDLLQRVEALDPELVMAQELFADIIASQPNSAFVKLLKKTPVLLEVPLKAGGVPLEEHVVMPQASDSLPPNAFAHWNDLSEWNGIDTPVKPRQNISSVPPVFSDWPTTHTSNAPEPAEKYNVEQQIPTQQLNAAVEDPWAMLERAAREQDQKAYQLAGQQSSQETADTDIARHEKGETAVWEAEHQPVEAELSDIDEWTLTAKEEYEPAVPSWLSMLTQEQSSRSGSVTPPASTPVQKQKPSTERSTASHSQSAEPEQVLHYQPARSSQLQANASGSDDDEESFYFGPEWLKSLGAALIDDASKADAPPSTPPRAPVLAEPESQPKTVFSPWTVQTPEPQRQEVSSLWAMPAPELQGQQAQNSLTPQVPAEAEQSFLRTLEDLEHGLRSQGFIPLEPKSLSTIALAQEAASSTASKGNIPEEVSQDQAGKQEEPTFSSALAQLGNFASPYEPAITVPAEPTQPAPERESGVPPSEPLWVASLNAPFALVPRPTSPLVPLAQSTVPSVQGDAPASPMQAQLPSVPQVQEPLVIPPIRVQEPAVVSPVRVDALPIPVLGPGSQSTQTTSPSPEPSKIPVARGDTLLDDELEMTMKRPAIRLSAAQQRVASAKQDAAAPFSKGYMGERSAANKTVEAGTNYKEHLLRGYQHQLVGDYDEAMQEYRILIKNAPELLSEVVSNVRALLKLAPRYSAGYRVLGDAYMRQGEYLQAMEAYNKALTMAKKARA